MKVIIFFVSEDSELCPSSGNTQRLQLIASKLPPINNGWRTIQISDQKQLWIHDEKLDLSKVKWKYIKKKLGNNVKEIYVALHSSMKESQGKIREKIQKLFQNKNIYMTLFSREWNDPVWRAFSDFMIKWIDNKEKAEEKFDSLANTIFLNYYKWFITPFIYLPNELKTIQKLREKGDIKTLFDFVEKMVKQYSPDEWEIKSREFRKLIEKLNDSKKKKLLELLDKCEEILEKLKNGKSFFEWLENLCQTGKQK